MMGLLHRKKELHPLGSFPVAPTPSEQPSERPAIQIAPSSFDVNSIFTTPPSVVSQFSADSSDASDFLLEKNIEADLDIEEDDEEDIEGFASLDEDEDDEADDLTLLHAQHIPIPPTMMQPPASPKSSSVFKGIRKSLGKIKKGFVWRSVLRKQTTTPRNQQRDDDTYSKPEFTSVDSFNLTRIERLRIHWEEWVQPRRKRVNRLVYHAAEDITEDELHSTSESSSDSSASRISEIAGPLKSMNVYPFTCASF